MKETERLTAVVPSERQKNWQELEFYAFLHYGMNTCTGLEWGDGKADPKTFSADALDTDQWVISLKAAEMKAVLFTAKHHDGFCLWDTKATDYNVMHSSTPIDVVARLSESCRKYGMKFGIYLSPWDRNNPTYGSEAYNDYFVSQLEELLTNYGELFCVWFDGACGEGPNGKRQVYDWKRYFKLIREKQPGAVINICGPDVRWCGNEAGFVREEEWSVVPARLSKAETVAALSQQEDSEEFRQKKINSRMADLGSREFLKDEKDLIWYPCEVDTSIRPGWFYKKSEDTKVRSFEILSDIYLSSVGGNAALLLNIPPDKHGRLHCEDVKRLCELGCFIRDTFGRSLANDALFVADSSAEGTDINVVRTNDNTSWRAKDGSEGAVIDITLKSPKKFNYITLMEDISYSQRIEKFSVMAEIDGEMKEIYSGKVVGHKKICRTEAVESSKIRIAIERSRGEVTLRHIGIHFGPEIPRMNG